MYEIKSSFSLSYMIFGSTHVRRLKFDVIEIVMELSCQNIAICVRKTTNPKIVGK